LKPDIIIATTDAEPPSAIAQLQTIGIEIVILDATPTVEAAKNRIKKLATLFNKEQTGELIISRLDNQLRQAVSYTQKHQTKPKVLFLYSRAQASAMISGRDTSADEMIRLSGGQNVITGYEGYKPITAEAVVAAAPEIILLPENSLKSIGGIDQLLKLPGVNQTPAGQNRKIVTMEDLKLLGFTPRLGDAVCELAKLLHQQDAIVEVEAKK
jgi:iron complex transport system substrate-binding protein